MAEAVAAMGFVQYDPIRCPSRAQDLILHQRVRGYREGDLDRAYARLGLEEGYLHVYGAMTRRMSALVDPGVQQRTANRSDSGGYVPSGLAADVLAVVRDCGSVHPREVALRLGSSRTTNAWGGMSSATTRALDDLHRHWLVRVVRRDKGVKVYGVASPPAKTPDRAECGRLLTLHLAKTLTPVSLSTLRGALVQLRRRGGFAASDQIDSLLRSGALTHEVVDGIDYVWPAEAPNGAEVSAADPSAKTSRRVRFLAPFDPVVWDRRRFAHLWGWPYRFEAYTPAAKRRFGYYALPMLMADRAVGWVQCVTSDRGLGMSVHFIDRRYKGKAFRSKFDREVSRLAAMLRVNVDAIEWP
jgi:uncharacterized protein YcaQ